MQYRNMIAETKKANEVSPMITELSAQRDRALSRES